MKFRFMLWDVLCTGKAWIKPANWLNPLDNGPQQMAPCEGAVLSVRFEVGVSLLLAPAGADKRGPKAPFPLVGYAGIQPAIRKRVPAGAPAGARSY